MKNPKIIAGAFITLVVLNLVLLAVLFFSRPCHGPFHGGHGPHHGGKHGRGPMPHRQLSIMSDKLDLNDDQENKFENEMDAFHEQMQTVMEEKMELKRKLIESVDTISKEDLLNSIADAERRLSKLEYDHFFKLRNLLNDDQKPKFDTVMKHMSKFRGHHKFRME